jgi:hypothetical protein
MKEYLVEALRVDQDSQNVGTPDDHMTARVLLGVRKSATEGISFFCTIKQPVGGAYQVEALEVSAPIGCPVKLDYGALRHKVADYYDRNLRMLGLHPSQSGSTQISMQGNIIVMQEQWLIPAASDDAGW